MLEAVLARPATPGAGRLLRIDGPSGSGKTTLARAVSRLALQRQVGCRVLHMDAMYDGWDGLPSVWAQLETLLPPLSEGRPGRYRVYDWRLGRYRRTVQVAPVPLLVLEGVGSGHPAYDHLGTVLVWVQAPPSLRRARALARDGADYEPHWEAWARSEAEVLARDRTRERADLVVDGASGEVSAAGR
ncbi:4-amino-4-deoxy-L-arabinose transferase [Nocardioides marinus]